jgi:amino acid permease
VNTRTLDEILINPKKEGKSLKEVLLNFSIGIVSGTFAGILSSMLIYLFSERRNKVRKIIEYAELTAENAYQILEETNECLNGKSIDTLKVLLKREVRRSFPGDIDDNSNISKDLQASIAKCNLWVYEVGEAIEDTEYRSKLFHANMELNNALLDIWNATTIYDADEDKKIEKYKKRFMIGIPCIIIFFIIIMIIALL